MKKLLFILAGLMSVVGIAKADVSVSGYTTVEVVTMDGDANVAGDSTFMETDTGISFAMSTTTDNGMDITSSLGFYVGDGATNVQEDGSGGISFSMDAVDITIGQNFVGDFASKGDVTSSFADGHNMATFSGASGVTSSAASDGISVTGQGVSISTSLTDTIGLDVTYLLNGVNEFDSFSSTKVDNNYTQVGLNGSFGDLSWTATMVSGDDSTGGHEISGQGGTISYTMGDITFDASIATTQNGANTTENDSAGASISYAMDDSTTVAIGMASGDNVAGDETSKLSLDINRSLGGGASVYASYLAQEDKNSGSAAVEGSAIALGTKVSF